MSPHVYAHNFVCCQGKEFSEIHFNRVMTAQPKYHTKQEPLSHWKNKISFAIEWKSTKKKNV